MAPATHHGSSTIERVVGSPRRPSRIHVFAQRAFWLLPLCLYVFTGSQTPGWADAPFIARNVHDLDLRVWANYHNLFTLAAAGWVKLLPWSIELHHALNLLCGVLGALTVHVIFSVGLRVTNNLVASAFGALALMLSHSLWWHSTMLEVYTLSSLLLAAIVLFVLCYDDTGKLKHLCIAAFCFGLACSNHAQMSLLLFGFIGIFLQSDQRQKLLTVPNLSLLAGSFLVGFQVYLWVFYSELATRWGGAVGDSATLGSIVESMFHEATGGGFRRYMFPAGLTFDDRLLWWLFFVGLVAYNFPSLALLVGPLGAWNWLRSGRNRVTLTFIGFCLIAQAIWAANYFVWDMYAFSLPIYTLFAVFVIVGIDWVYRRHRALRVLLYVLGPTLFVSPLLYAKTPEWLAVSERSIELLDTLPQYAQATALWNPLPYFFDPNKRGFDQVERYSEEAMRQLDPSACYWGDEAKLLYPLKYYYQESLGRRTDVRYNLIFAILQGAPAFHAHATQLVRQLRSGCSVYVSSIGYPERDVLNYVYSLLGGGRDPMSVARMSQEELVATFPKYRLEAVDLDEAEGTKIYKLVRRPSGFDSLGDR